MSEFMYDAAKVLSTVILTSVLTYYMGIKKDKKILKRDYAARQLDEVYEPINRVFDIGTLPYEGYQGVGVGGISQIIDIIEKNSPLIDEGLKDYYWELKECADQARGYENFGPVFDKDGEFHNFIQKSINGLRKRTYRPYVSISLRGRRIINALIIRQKLKRKLHRKG